jgi:hypothetical protein
MNKDIILNNIHDNTTPIFTPPIRYKYINGVLHIACFLHIYNEGERIQICTGNNYLDKWTYISIDDIEQILSNNTEPYVDIIYRFNINSKRFYEKFKYYYNEIDQSSLSFENYFTISIVQLKSLAAITFNHNKYCSSKDTKYSHIYPDKNVYLTMKYRILFKDET